MKNAQYTFIILLIGFQLNAQRRTEIKLDLLAPLHRSVSLALERHISPKVGIQASFAYTWDRLTIDTSSVFTTSHLGSEKLLYFPKRVFGTSILARYYPWGNQQSDINAYIGTAVSILWVTHVDPEYYTVHRLALGREAIDPYLNYPDINAGIVIGMKTPILKHFTLEPSIEGLVSLTQWFDPPSRKSRVISMDSYFRILIGYEFGFSE